MYKFALDAAYDRGRMESGPALPSSERDVANQPITVLVVDDDAPLMEGLLELLEEEGCTVVSAPNGREALDRLREGLRPDVILLDLVMPVMNGWEFRREQLANDNLKSIPVVVLTAAGFPSSRVKAELGEIEFVPKPPPSGAVTRAIALSLQRSESG